MDTFLRRVVRIGFRRGMSGSQAWLALGISAIGIRTLRKMARGPDVLYRTEIRPGDRFEIGDRPR